jgi:hypothetical protein
MISEHPATFSNIKEIESFESQFDSEKLIDNALKNSDLRKFMN